MTELKNPPSSRSGGSLSAQSDLDAIRKTLGDRSSWGEMLRDEARFFEFMDRCREAVDHADRLRFELEELSLVHESTLEHATNIENELELRNRLINEELKVAHKVQRALLADHGGSIASEFEMAIHHKQLEEVGGDYYDFFYLPGERHAIGVYDISGHGVSSALIMAFLKAQFAHATKRHDSPKEIVEWVNQSAFSFLREVRRYATVNFVMFSDRSLRYVSGGGYGLVVHRGTPVAFNKLNNFIGLRLKPFREFELPFEEGDILALYTDGMLAAQDNSGEGYSVQRLNDIIVQHSSEPVQAILDRCLEDYAKFRVDDVDDITLLILRRCVR